jgi:NAD(P)-dependent dehydrogenase (short-subunit alcohol dehydrogenase family)
MDFRDRVVLIAGAARGIGLACAQAFADHGATVAISDLDEVSVKRALGSLASDAAHSAHSAHVIDLADVSQTAKLVDNVVALHNRLDVLVSTVGVLRAESFLDLMPESWDLTLNVNTRGGIFLAQAASTSKGASSCSPLSSHGTQYDRIIPPTAPPRQRWSKPHVAWRWNLRRTE